MPISVSDARKICTKSELELILESTATKLTTLSDARLRSNVAQARRLRDKYRDLAAQQRREARGKGKPRGANPSQGNDRTVQKQKLFDVALRKFEAQLRSHEKGEPDVSPKVAREIARREKKAKAVARRTQKNEPTLSNTDVVTAGGTGKKDMAPDVAAAEASNNKVNTETSSGEQPAPKPSKKRRGGILASLMGSGGVAELAARNTSLKSRSDATSGQRIKNMKGNQNLRKIHAHVGARGRRSQAKRDSK